jgi:DNA-binding response OmpR family regulator/DNA-binding CsgD family transcriptional regulator
VKDGTSILIVDDVSANVDMLRKILEAEGYSISMAPNGEVALDRAAKIKPDLILMDVMMPGIDRFETCRKLKEDSVLKNTPILFVTGKTETEDIVEGFRAGGADYITKPFRSEEVIARVGTHLRLRGSIEKLEKFNQHLEELVAARTHELQKKNLALSEILSQIELERKQIKDAVRTNSDKLILPIIKKLRNKGGDKNSQYYDILEKSVKELTLEFGNKISDNLFQMSSREIEICNLIKNGFEGKEMSRFLDISYKTVETHRRNIRRKLGIVNKSVNLTTFLNSM